MAHNPKFDTTTPEGAAIVRLFNGIRNNIEDENGGWNGADTVDALTEWFTRLGIDVDAGSGLITT